MVVVTGKWSYLNSENRLFKTRNQSATQLCSSQSLTIFSERKKKTDNT